MKPYFTIIFFASVMTLMTGCGSDLPPLGTVSGVVMQNGKPVEGVSIELVPVAGGRPSMALTDKEGKYNMLYLPDEPGALVGKHTVRYQVFGPQPATPADPDAMVIPTATSDVPPGLKMQPSEVDVTDGVNEVNFEFLAEK